MLNLIVAVLLPLLQSSTASPVDCTPTTVWVTPEQPYTTITLTELTQSASNVAAGTATWLTTVPGSIVFETVTAPGTSIVTVTVTPPVVTSTLAEVLTTTVVAPRQTLTLSTTIENIRPTDAASFTIETVPLPAATSTLGNGPPHGVATSSRGILTTVFPTTGDPVILPTATQVKAGISISTITEVSHGSDQPQSPPIQLSGTQASYTGIATVVTETMTDFLPITHSDAALTTATLSYGDITITRTLTLTQLPTLPPYLNVTINATLPCNNVTGNYSCPGISMNVTRNSTSSYSGFAFIHA